MLRPLLTLSFALCALTACTVDENGNFVNSPSTSASAGKPRISQLGTCFMFVTEEGDGKYTLTTGVGDGSKTPMGIEKKGLSAAALDKRYAEELEVMNILPECLAILATDRTEARPAPKTATPVKTATK